MEVNTNSTVISHGIGFEELAEFFHLPINQVSKELGVCATVLKKICRRNGIPRWPHRKIKSLDRMIKALETTVPNTPEEQERIHREIEEMKNKKMSILRNPNTIETSQKYRPNKSSKKPKNHSKKPYDRPQIRGDEEDLRAFSESASDSASPIRSLVEVRIPDKPAPSSQIASTVTEIMSNLRAKREREAAEELEHLRFGFTQNIGEFTRLSLPNNHNLYPGTVAPLYTLPTALPMLQIPPINHSGIHRLLNLEPPRTSNLPKSDHTSDAWPIRIAPILNSEVESSLRLPVLEPNIDNPNLINTRKTDYSFSSR